MKRGFSLIELVVVMLLVAIIGGASSGSIMYVVQLFTYLPVQMQVRTTAHEVEDIIIEGDIDRRGLRYAKSIIDSSASQVTYSYGYPETAKYVRFRYNSSRIYVSTSLEGSTWTAEEAIPRNITSDISVQGKAAPSSVFTYYQTNNAQFTPGNDVTYIKRIDVNIKVTSSAGSLKGEAASFAVSSGVDIKQYV